MEARKTTLVGLDGVSWSLVEDLIEHATVPNLEELVNESVHGITKSTVPCLTCPALPSLYTGQNPGNIGIFDFVKPDGDIVDYTDVIEPAVWDYLGACNVSMVVGAMRTTHPAPDVNGIFISDVLSTSGEPDYVSPESARDYGNRFHRLRERLEADKQTAEPDDLLETFAEFNDERVDVFLDLLDAYEPTFALLWFGLTDGVQHYFWDDRPRLYQFFERFDERLAEITAACSDSNLVVVGDHGFGPPVRYQFHLNEALRRGGFLELSGGTVREKLTEIAYMTSEQYISDDWKRRLLAVVNRVRGGYEDDGGETGERGATPTVVTSMDTLPGIDWSMTQAHAATRKGWGVNLVRQNVADFETTREMVIDCLLDIKTPDGDPAVKAAWPGEEVYWGRYSDQVPDIVVLSHDTVRVRPSVVGSLFTPGDPDNKPGHESAREAIFMATGPDVDDDAGNVGELDIYDVAPTLMALLGVPVPDAVDGRPIPGLVSGPEPIRTTYPAEQFRIRHALGAVGQQL